MAPAAGQQDVCHRLRPRSHPIRIRPSHARSTARRAPGFASRTKGATIPAMLEAPAPDWHAANLAAWDESVPIHLRSDFYDVAALRAGTARLYPIEHAELGPVAGLRVLHLQCHFGYDSFILARQGADVTGLDFSPAAIATARALADEFDLSPRARFVEADLYEAPAAIDRPGGFNLVLVTWGALMWLPDIDRWAGIVAHFLAPGGRLYLADGHPCAISLRCDDGPDPCLRLDTPYFAAGPIPSDDPADYADPAATLTNARMYTFQHPLGAIVTALARAGLILEFLHEHDAIPWRLYSSLRADPDRMFRWPDQPWLPLAFSLSARRA